MKANEKNTIEHGGSVSATGSALNDPALLKRAELARALSISSRSVDNLQRRKVIPSVRISPRMVRFSLPAVLRALDRFTVKEAK